MRVLREIDADSLTPYILTIGLILLISAPILPVAVIMFIQDMLFFSYDHLSFIRPQAAYSGFAAGLVLVAVTLFSFLFTKLYAEKKRRDYRLAGLHLFLLSLALPLFILSIFNYAYLDEDGVHVNHSGRLQKRTLRGGKSRTSSGPSMKAHPAFFPIRLRTVTSL